MAHLFAVVAAIVGIVIGVFGGSSVVGVGGTTLGPVGYCGSYHETGVVDGSGTLKFGLPFRPAIANVSLIVKTRKDPDISRLKHPCREDRKTAEEGKIRQPIFP